MDDKNKKANRLNSLSRLEVTSASQTKGSAKVIINNEIATQKLIYRIMLTMSIILVFLLERISRQTLSNLTMKSVLMSMFIMVKEWRKWKIH